MYKMLVACVIDNKEEEPWIRYDNAWEFWNEVAHFISSILCIMHMLFIFTLNALEINQHIRFLIQKNENKKSCLLYELVS